MLTGVALLLGSVLILLEPWVGVAIVAVGIALVALWLWRPKAQSTDQ